MKKAFSSFIIFLFFLQAVSAKEVIYSCSVPNYILVPYNNKRRVSNYCEINSSKNGAKVILLKFVCYEDNISDPPKVKMLSRIVFLDKSNNILKELNINSYTWTTLIDDKKTPILAVTETVIEGYDINGIKVSFYNLQGEKISTLYNLLGSFVRKTCKDDALVIELDAMPGVAGFHIIPLKTILSSKKIKTYETFNSYKFPNLETHNVYCAIGGKNLDAVVYSEGTIKKISLKNKKTYWQINNFKNDVFEIKLLDNNHIGVWGDGYLTIINLQNGKFEKILDVSWIINEIEKISPQYNCSTHVFFKGQKIRLTFYDKDNKLISYAIIENPFSESEIVYKIKKRKELNGRIVTINKGKVYLLEEKGDTIKIIQANEKEIFTPIKRKFTIKIEKTNKSNSSKI